MGNLKTHKQNRIRFKDTENKLVVSKKEGTEGMNETGERD